MRSRLLFLISFFACQTLFAQTIPGIAVQGIARDANKAALVDELLTFTFEIKSDATTYYTETAEIRTDPYGVFSHIIGTGEASGGNSFNEVPFDQFHMDLVISVNDVIISSAPFQYTPYAKSAANGVPTGTIMAFLGGETDVPPGWVFCDGRTLTGIKFSGNLQKLVGENVPDLRGMFLRGAGQNESEDFESQVGSPADEHSGPVLMEMQGDGFKDHNHDKGTLEIPSSGKHDHYIYLNKDKPYDNGDDGDFQRYGTDSSDGTDKITTSNGAHTHPIQGATGYTGIGETRPVNYGVNYIIKL